MKHKHKHKHRANKLKGMHRRNSASGAVSVAPRPRAPSKLRRSAAPEWKTILAAVAGGAGSAALGGLVVNQQILSPEAVGIGLMLGGGATAYFSDGTPRIVGASVAASGAGQFALALMNKRAIKAHDDARKESAAPALAPPQLPAPPPVAPRQRATGGGAVVDMFRDAADQLDSVEDEWRYGIRDDAYAHPYDGEPVVIDLDQAT